VTFTLKIESGNDAMRTPSDVALVLMKEVAPRLVELDGIAPLNERGAIHDLNGNTVGAWRLTVKNDG